MRVRWQKLFLYYFLMVFIFGCSPVAVDRQSLSDVAPVNNEPYVDTHYLIGPGDSLSVFVWGNPDLSAMIPVRPDGKITTPLVEDVEASGKTPTELARMMEKRLSRYVKTPIVTVTVTSFIGHYNEQVRVIGEAFKPQSLPFRKNMTVLDVVIAVGGLTKFAAGNSAKIIRTTNGKQEQIGVKLNNLIKRGDISANINMRPGDVLIIPESWF